MEPGLSEPRRRGPWGPFFAAVGGAALATAAAVTAAEAARAWGTAAASALDFVFILTAILALIVTAVAAAVLGLPLTWLLAGLGWETPWTYPSAGLVAGAALLTAFDPFAGDYSWLAVDEAALTAALGGLPGFVCGLIWWRLYRRHCQPGALP